MKKSELYRIAMESVLNDRDISSGEKLEVLEMLMSEAKLALWAEEYEGKEGAEG